MKKIITLVFLFSILCTLFTQVSAQTTISNSGVYIFNGTEADTIKINQSKDLNLYVPTYCTQLKVLTTAATISGKTKYKTVTMGSLDYVNWVRIDSVTVNANNTAGYTALTAPWYNYLKIRTTAIDSTGKTRIKRFVLIKNN